MGFAFFQFRVLFFTPLKAAGNMKIKPLKSIVKSLAEISASARLDSSFDFILNNEIEELNIDLLSTALNESTLIPFHSYLCEWFYLQLKSENVELANIEVANVVIQLDFKSIETDLSKVALFHINSHCVIIINDKKFESNAVNKIWFHRKSVE